MILEKASSSGLKGGYLNAKLHFSADARRPGLNAP